MASRVATHFCFSAKVKAIKQMLLAENKVSRVRVRSDSHWWLTKSQGHNILTDGWFSEKVYQGGDRVRVCITHLLSIKQFNIGDFHVSVAINI